jgi:hypothetical protein
MTTHLKVAGQLDDVALATMALAGIRELKQSSVGPTASAAAAYTVTEADTRRVMCFHLGCTVPAAGDIRMRFNATASAAYMPLLPQRYVVFEAVAGETISFFNTGADTVTVYVMELM